MEAEGGLNLENSEPTCETEDSRVRQNILARYTTKCTVLVDRIQPNAHDSVRLNVTSRRSSVSCEVCSFFLDSSLFHPSDDGAASYRYRLIAFLNLSFTPYSLYPLIVLNPFIPLLFPWIYYSTSTSYYRPASFSRAAAISLFPKHILHILPLFQFSRITIIYILPLLSLLLFDSPYRIHRYYSFFSSSRSAHC
jgi:hypothetical protein